MQDNDINPRFGSRQENKKNNKDKKRFLAGFFVLGIIFSFILGALPTYEIFAQADDVLGSVNMNDYMKSMGEQGLPLMEADIQYLKTLSPEEYKQLMDVYEENKKGNFLSKWIDKLRYLWDTAASKALNIAIGNAMKKFAYDAATDIGSGNWGQKSMFYGEKWEEYLYNIGDSAAGDFIQKLGDYGNFNLCSPRLDVQFKIRLGLTQYVRPSEPDCTLSEMTKNWGDEAKRLHDMNQEDFLDKFSKMWEPAGNEASLAFSVHTKMFEEIEKKKMLAEKDRDETDGWLDFRDTAWGKRVSPPMEAKSELEQAKNLQVKGFGQATKDNFIDALNVFVNQLAITSFNKLLQKLTKGESITSPGNIPDVENFYAQAQNPGMEGAKANARDILKQKFISVADYNILPQLSMCPNKERPTTINCVITDKFGDAIESKKTVRQAVEEELLDGNSVFGFVSAEAEPSYEAGYPLRSMLILRKYRVIPVGWELAAQFISDNFSKVVVVNNVEKKMGGAKSLNDLLACYSNSDDLKTEWSEGANSYTSWCRGLVDPDWVLKMPNQYCARQGFGPNIQTSRSAGKGTANELKITRGDDYCADERSCLAEKSDGSCAGIYGYCTEEKRKWNFDSEACDPLYNTCQTFTSRKGSTASYLQNTLTYEPCDRTNVGCQAYVEGSGYTPGTEFLDVYSYAGTWSGPTKSLEKLEADDPDPNGIKAAWEGTNVIFLVDSERVYSLNGDVVSGNINDYFYISENPKDQVPNFSQVRAAWSGSGNIYFISGAGLYAYTTAGGVNNAERWKKFNDAIEPTVDAFYKPTTGFNYYTAFTALNAPALGGIKTAWLNSKILNLTDSKNHYTYNFATPSVGWQAKSLEEAFILDPATNEPKPGAPASMGAMSIAWLTSGVNFAEAVSEPDKIAWGSSQLYFDRDAKECDEEAEGCHMFIRNLNEPAYLKLIPAYLESSCYQTVTGNKTKSLANAPAVCDNYVRKCGSAEVSCELYTSTSNDWKIPAIPQEADKCPAECVGYEDYAEQPTQFDLDSLHFNLIPKTAKACDLNAVGCTQFTNLDKLDQGGEAIEYYKYLRQCIKPNDADCGDFYTWQGSGETGYQLKAFKFKKAETGDIKPSGTFTGDLPKLITNGLYDNADCNDATDMVNNPMCWEFYNTNGEIFHAFYPNVVLCADDCHPYRLDGETSTECSTSGGTLNGGACIYQAVPNESLKCSASANKCREYHGPSGGNVEDVLVQNFDSGIEDWSGVQISTESTADGGRSIMISSNGTGSYAIGQNVRQGSGLVLSFVAKTDSTNTQSLTVKIGEPFDTAQAFNAVSGSPTGITTEWNEFFVNLESLNEPTENTKIFLRAGSGKIYIDNLKLTEIVDRYYLIKNSWVTPYSCDNSFDEPYGDGGQVSPTRDILGHMVGCDRYIDRFGENFNFKSFSSPCDKNAVGCELMKDTGNTRLSSDDTPIHVVYDPKKKCNAEQKGCERFGLITTPNEYSDTWIINDPDAPERLCGQNAVDCEEWAVEGKGSAMDYFKNPKDSVCSYDGSYWKDSSGADCDISVVKTFGYGGNGKKIDQPTGKVGVCPEKQSGCTEYIDPVSSFGVNLVYNPEMADLDGNSSLGDGWDGGTSQTVEIEPNTLYVFEIAGAGNMSVAFANGTKAYKINSDNKLAASSASYTVLTDNTLVVFNYDYTSVAVTVSGVQAGKTLASVRKAVVDYQFAQNITDEGCNGAVNFKEGCVLFNERVWKGKDGYEVLKWNAYQTYANPTGELKTGIDSNKIIKVTPDRICDKWLACKTYVKETPESDPTCFEVGLCNKLDDKNQCDNFLVVEKDNLNYAKTYPKDKVLNIANLSGYVKTGFGNQITNKPVSYYNLAAMTQAGEVAKVSNGGFEISGTNGWPLGWSVDDDEVWEAGKFRVISGPVEAQQEGIEVCYIKNEQNQCLVYAPEGQGYLAYSPGLTTVYSDFIDVEPNTEYVMSMKINTKNFHGDSTIIKSSFNANILTYDNQGKRVNASGSGVNQFDSNGNALTAFTRDLNACEDTASPDKRGCEISLDGGKGWTALTRRFRVGDNTQKIKFFMRGMIRYGSGDGCTTECSFAGSTATCPTKTYKVTTDSCSGSIYIDDVKLMPALEVKNLSPKPVSPATTPAYYKFINKSRECRLYPSDEALSCDYYDETGMRNLGLWGYCLEYDRAPGDPNSCLMWYPVDNIKGTGIIEGARGYRDKFPLYYAVNKGGNVIGTLRTAVDDDHVIWINGKMPRKYVNGNLLYSNACNFHWGNNSVSKSLKSALGGTAIDPVGRNFCSQLDDKYGNLWYDTSVVKWTSYDAEVDCPLLGNDLDGCEFSQGNKIYDNSEGELRYGNNLLSVFVGDKDDSGERWLALGLDPRVGDQNSIGMFDSIKTSDSENWKCIGIANDKYIDEAGCNWTSAPQKCAWWKLNLDYPGWSTDYDFDDTAWASPIISADGGAWEGAMRVEKIWAAGYKDSEGSSMLCRYKFTVHAAGTALVQVVNSVGENKYWASRVQSGSDYKVPCNLSIVDFDGTGGVNPVDLFLTPGKTCIYTGEIGKTSAEFAFDSRPFGAVVPPGNYMSELANPYEWDSLSGEKDNQPLYWMSQDDVAYTGGGQARMGQLHSIDYVKRLFAQSYGYWEWQPINNKCKFLTKPNLAVKEDCVVDKECTLSGVCNLTSHKCSNNANTSCDDDTDCADKCLKSHYLPSKDPVGIWTPPTSLCIGKRGTYPDDWCAIKPQVVLIKVNGKDEDVIIHNKGLVNLTFNSVVDNQQTPLTMFDVDWIDGKTVVSGVEMSPRDTVENPHSLYHMYSYWDLKAKDNLTGNPYPGITCYSNYCEIKPMIRIKDNWGWCQDGDNTNPCPGGYVLFGKLIKVYEK